MIVVAGESLVDLIGTGEGALAPSPGGGPFNVARALARLGMDVAFLGAVSDDGFGRLLRETLRRDGVDLRGLVASTLPTMLALAQLDAAGSAGYRFYAEATAAPSLTPGQAAVALRGLDVEALHVGSLGLALEPLAAAVEQTVEQVPADTLVMVDPNWRPGAVDDPRRWRARLGRVLARADVVKVSTEDLDHLAPGEPRGRAACALLAGRTKCLLVTAGGEAVQVITREGVRSLRPPATQVVDSVGAGDAFCAGFLAATTAAGVRGERLGSLAAVVPSAEFAAVVAARTCARQGAEPPRLAELGSHAGLAVA
jgi:fructokinase